MSQFLRPSSNVTQTNFTGGYAEIDETSASDADVAYANSASATCTLEVGLSSGVRPGSGTSTVRYRYAKANLSGTPTSNDSHPTFQAFIYEGASLIATDTLLNPSSGTYTTREWTPDLSAVTDWSDLRIRFVVGTTGGGGARGVVISWAELEIPSPSSGFMAFF